MSEDLQKPATQKSDQIVDSSNLDCNSGLIAHSFHTALTIENTSTDLEPPLKGLTDDFGKWHPVQLPADAAPLTIQRAVILLSRPALKQRAARRKSIDSLSLTAGTSLRIKDSKPGNLNENNM